MAYVRVNGAGDVVEWPFKLSDLRNENPRTSFPGKITEQVLNRYDVHEVKKLPEPAYNPDTQFLEQEVLPVRVGGEYFIGFEVRNMTSQQITSRAKQKAKTAFDKEEESIGSNFSEQEKRIMLAAYDEARRFEMDNTAATPMIDAIKAQVYPTRTRAQIANILINRTTTYLQSAGIALAQKIQAGG